MVRLGRFSLEQRPNSNNRQLSTDNARSMNSFRQLSITFQLLLILWTPMHSRADEPPQTFPTSQQISQEIVTATCNAPYRGLVVLRNSAGLIGGYVRIPAIMDSPIPYLDSNGKHLAMFHIFGSMEEKKKASSVIDQLRSQFPVEERVDCSNQAK